MSQNIREARSGRTGLGDTLRTDGVEQGGQLGAEVEQQLLRPHQLLVGLCDAVWREVELCGLASYRVEWSEFIWIYMGLHGLELC